MAHTTTSASGGAGTCSGLGDVVSKKSPSTALTIVSDQNGEQNCSLLTSLWNFSSDIRCRYSKCSKKGYSFMRNLRILASHSFVASLPFSAGIHNLTENQDDSRRLRSRVRKMTEILIQFIRTSLRSLPSLAFCVRKSRILHVFDLSFLRRLVRGTSRTLDR